MKSEL